MLVVDFKVRLHFCLILHTTQHQNEGNTNS